MVLGNYYGGFFAYSYKTFGESTGTHPQISDLTLTWAASIGAGLVNGLSRVFIGTLVDKYSFKTLMGILMTIQLVNACVCFWAAYVPALYFICILVNYGCVAGIFTVFPSSVTNVFGLELGPQIYVHILCGGFISSILNLLTSKYLLPATNFVTMFYVGAIFQVVTLLFIWWFKEELDVENLAKRNALKLKLPQRATHVA